MVHRCQSFLDIENRDDYYAWLQNPLTAAVYGDTIGFVTTAAAAATCRRH